MKNSIIGTLVTQVQSGITKSRKTIDSQLKGAPSIKDLQILERLEHLKQNNKRNNSDDNDDDDDDDDDDTPPPSAPVFDLLPYYLPLPSFDSDDDSDIERENPIQKFLLGNKAKKKLQSWWEKKMQLLRDKKLL